MLRSAVALGIVAGALSACASTSPVHPPFLSQPAPSAQDATPFHRDPHRQYYDALHKRYYYFDPARQAYFWENGQPKA